MLISFWESIAIKKDGIRLEGREGGEGGGGRREEREGTDKEGWNLEGKGECCEEVGGGEEEDLIKAEALKSQRGEQPLTFFMRHLLSNSDEFINECVRVLRVIMKSVSLA